MQPDGIAGSADQPSNFRAAPATPQTSAQSPGRGGTTYHNFGARLVIDAAACDRRRLKQLKHARNAALSAELWVFCTLLAIGMRVFGW